VFDRATGSVARVINPDFESQLDGHHVGPHEFMVRSPKQQWGIADKPNAMTLDHVHRIIAALSK
jgi:hypothetical protein